MLKYHAKSLDLIGVRPQPSPEAARQIEILEKRIGRPLPASLREWYALDGAAEILTTYSNDDGALDIDELGTEGLVADNFLVFKHENQGVCSWAIVLDGTDDPPVVVSYDSYEADFKKHKRCVEHFSDYVYSCIWDWGLALRWEILVQAQNRALSQDALAFLRKHFKEEIQTRGWPADTQYRFHFKDQRILLWCAKDQADWWLSAESEASLLDLTRKVWSIDDVGDALWADGDAGTMVLREARDAETPEL